MSRAPDAALSSLSLLIGQINGVSRNVCRLQDELQPPSGRQGSSDNHTADFLPTVTYATMGRIYKLPRGFPSGTQQWLRSQTDPFQNGVSKLRRTA